MYIDSRKCNVQMSQLDGSWGLHGKEVNWSFDMHACMQDTHAVVCVKEGHMLPCMTSIDPHAYTRSYICLYIYLHISTSSYTQYKMIEKYVSDTIIIYIYACMYTLIHTYVHVLTQYMYRERDMHAHSTKYIHTYTLKIRGKPRVGQTQSWALWVWLSPSSLAPNSHNMY